MTEEATWRPSCRRVPPLDVQQPLDTRTATFALG